MITKEFMRIIRTEIEVRLRRGFGSDLDDCVSDVTAELLPKFRMGTFSDKPKAYLKTAAFNSALQWKKKRRVQEQPIGQILLPGEPGPPEIGGTNPEDAIIDAIDRKKGGFHASDFRAHEIGWIYSPQWWDDECEVHYGPKSQDTWAQWLRDWKNDLWRPADMHPKTRLASERRKGDERNDRLRATWMDVERHLLAVTDEETQNRGALLALDELRRLRNNASKRVRPTAMQMGRWLTDLQMIGEWVPSHLRFKMEVDLDPGLGGDASRFTSLIDEAMQAVRIRWLPNSSLPHLASRRGDAHLQRDLVVMP